MLASRPGPCLPNRDRKKTKTAVQVKEAPEALIKKRISIISVEEFDTENFNRENFLRCQDLSKENERLKKAQLFHPLRSRHVTQSQMVEIGRGVGRTPRESGGPRRGADPAAFLEAAKKHRGKL